METNYRSRHYNAKKKIKRKSGDSKQSAACKKGNGNCQRIYVPKIYIESTQRSAVCWSWSKRFLAIRFRFSLWFWFRFLILILNSGSVIPDLGFGKWKWRSATADDFGKRKMLAGANKGNELRTIKI